MRADARRNRDAILAAAREVFDEEGVFAPLDTIAVRAGVGNATLYRNFPTRDDLLAAMMDAGIAGALVDAEELARTRRPHEALLEWLVELSWQLRIWHDLPYCISASRSDPDSSLEGVRSPLLERTELLLDQAQASGDAVRSVTADEVFELVTALSWGVDRFGDDEVAARRRVTIGTAGVFTSPAPPDRPAI